VDLSSGNDDLEPAQQPCMENIARQGKLFSPIPTFFAVGERGIATIEIMGRPRVTGVIEDLYLQDPNVGSRQDDYKLTICFNL